jgi:hypothetical protein
MPLLIASDINTNTPPTDNAKTDNAKTRIEIEIIFK